MIFRQFFLKRCIPIFTYMVIRAHSILQRCCRVEKQQYWLVKG